jgi:hypothetical protein
MDYIAFYVFLVSSTTASVLLGMSRLDLRTFNKTIILIPTTTVPVAEHSSPVPLLPRQATQLLVQQPNYTPSLGRRRRQHVGLLLWPMLTPTLASRRPYRPRRRIGHAPYRSNRRRSSTVPRHRISHVAVLSYRPRRRIGQTVDAAQQTTPSASAVARRSNLTCSSKLTKWQMAPRRHGTTIRHHHHRNHHAVVSCIVHAVAAAPL